VVGIVAVFGCTCAVGAGGAMALNCCSMLDWCCLHKACVELESLTMHSTIRKPSGKPFIGARWSCVELRTTNLRTQQSVPKTDRATKGIRIQSDNICLTLPRTSKSEEMNVTWSLESVAKRRGGDKPPTRPLQPMHSHR